MMRGIARNAIMTTEINIWERYHQHNTVTPSMRILIRIWYMLFMSSTSDRNGWFAADRDGMLNLVAFVDVTYFFSIIDGTY